MKGDERRRGIIPDYGAVIFDEAHEMEDVAGQYFGVTVSQLPVRGADARRRVRSRIARSSASQELDRILITLGGSRRRSSSRCSAPPRAAPASGRTRRFSRRTRKPIATCWRALELIALQLELLKAAPEEVDSAGPPRARRSRARLQFWMESGDRALRLLDRARGRGTFLQATPIDVSQLLDEKLFDAVDTVVLTSATLAVAGEFEFTKSRLGLRTRAHAGRAQPFRLPETGAAVRAAESCPIRAIPRSQPPPPTRSSRSCTHSRGRAFVLFTSYQQMRLIYDRVSLEIPYQTLLQGTGPRSALLEEFRATPNAVLFATSSFWQGVDVPGEQLSCVIIDKLPFAVPSDPVVEARIAAIRERRRRSVLRLPGPAGRHRAEAGIRAADPQPDGSRRAGAAG